MIMHGKSWLHSEAFSNSEWGLKSKKVVLDMRAETVTGG